MTEPIPSPAGSWRWKSLFLLLFCAIAGLHLWALARMPSYFVDEAVSLSRATAVLATGRPVGVFDSPQFALLGGNGALIPPLGYYFDAALLAVGLPTSIPTLRLVSLSFGLLYLLCSALLAGRLFGPLAACLTLTFTGLSPAFIWGTHISRPDVTAAALGFLGVVLAINASAGASRIALSSFLGGLALSCHGRALAHLITQLVVLVVSRGRRLFQLKPLMALAAGLGAAGLVLFVLQIVPYAQNAATLHAHVESMRAVAPPVASGSIHVILETVKEFLLIWRQLNPVAWPLFALGAPLLLVTKSQQERTVAMLVVTTLAAGLLTIHGMVPVKMIMISPVLDLMIPLILFSILPRLPLRQPLVTALVFVAALPLGMQMEKGLKDLLTVDSGCAEENDAFRAALAQQLSPGASVMGEETFWPLVTDHPYYSWKLLRLLTESRGGTLGEALEHFHPDYFIVDKGLRVFLKDEPFEDRFYESMRISGTELWQAISKHATIPVKLQTACYGRMELWRLDWNPSAMSPVSPLPESSTSPQ